MKIVHLVLSDNFAGIEQHVNELLSDNSLNKSILICNKSISNNFGKNIKTFVIKNIGRRSLWGKYKLKKLLKQIDPDIVHTHGSKTTSIISSINKNNFKHVATVHGIKRNKKIYEKADLVIGVSKKAIEGIKNKSVVITNWWHPELVKFDLKKNDYALAIGRLEKVKGFDLLIASWKNIKTKLVIIGSGQEKQNLINLIDQNNLSTRIKIIDDMPRDELISFYKNASVLIISSRDEGGPRVALEALFLEIPVISTDVGHMSNILPNEVLAKKNDKESLTELLETYIDNIELLNQDAIFEYITNDYSIEKKVSEIIRCYEGLFNN